MSALDYFLKANLYGLLFAGCYWILLRRHTFFSLNRAYLLASAVLSLALPLASLPTQTVDTLAVPVGVITLPLAAVSIDSAEIAPVAAQPDWEQIGLIAYGLIASVLVLRFSVRTARLLRLIRQSPQQVCDGYVLVQPNDPTIPTFSFFRYVILNPADTHNNLIIQHELVHVRQYHSVDVVSMALVRAVVWACPSLWLIDYMLRQVHEFLADKPVGQPTEYARFLIDYSFGLQPSLRGSHTLTNSFFKPSLLKQRILMLHREATTHWALVKYALILPLAFGLLAMTTARERISSIVSQANNAKILVGSVGMPLQRLSGDIPSQDEKLYTVVQQQPSFPGGMAGLRRYLTQTLRYPTAARQNKVEGRVFIKFVVSKAGDVQNVSILKGLGHGCDEEALRVMQQMPKWIPGKEQGKAVAVQYNLPIQFSLAKKKEDKRTGKIEPIISKLTADEIVDIPTTRYGNYPHQPILTIQTKKVPAGSFKSDTVPQSTLLQKPDTSVTIRGKGPLGQLDGDPLIIIDGVEIPKSTPKPLNGLDPHSIESITVLKSASATSVYGDKGKDGVIIVKSKKK